jgi:hypothetical protein
MEADGFQEFNNIASVENVLFANSKKQLFYSTDQGASWQNITKGLPNDFSIFDDYIRGIVKMNDRYFLCYHGNTNGDEKKHAIYYTDNLNKGWSILNLALKMILLFFSK